MEGDAESESQSPEACSSGMNGSAEAVTAGIEEEDWTAEDAVPQPTIRYFTPHHRLLPSPGALTVNSQRMALSVSALTGRFWRGAVAVAPLPNPEAEEVLIDLEAVCELPSGVCDLSFVGHRAERILTGHDDGCVSLLALEEKEAGSKRLLPITFAVEHDTLVRRVCVGAGGDTAASLEEGGRVRIWMLEPFLSVHSFTAFPFAGSDLSLHPRRRNLLAAAGNTFGAAGGRLLSLSIWDLREATSGTTAKAYGGVSGGEDASAFSALAWSSVDDDWLFASDRAGYVHLFDLRSLKEPVTSRRGVHGGWAVERMVVQGARVLTTALDRRTVALKVCAEDGGLARLREESGAAFRHSSNPQGLAAAPGGDVWWTSELSGAVWCHGVAREASKARLNPPLNEIEF